MKINGFYLLVIVSLVLVLSGTAFISPSAAEQQDEDIRPFSLPFLDLPGPDTWLMVQPYGNTIDAYRNRSGIYRAGQGMHFGIDLAARCGYPVSAIGDGVVVKVDASQHGAAPHNLMIDHPNGYASFYGHLLQRPSLTVGQQIKRGEIVGLVGDPDLTCTSRPHLHLEIRNAGAHNRAFNPVELIAADWDTLLLTGSFFQGFARDLSDPLRWQRVDDQPEVAFGGRLLNEYQQVWPPEWKP
jgi:murein DD-endopeptidase MepM/ murein hydrolase activator NlpD